MSKIPHFSTDNCRRYILATITKWMIIRDKTYYQIFQMSQVTWNKRNSLELDFTTEEIQRAIYLLQIPEREVSEMMMGGNKWEA